MNREAMALPLTDAEYVLELIDETFANVPQVKEHHERMRKIAATLSAIEADRAASPTPVAAEQAVAARAAAEWASLWPAARDVLSERRRQVSAEGWTPKHDDAHTDGGLAEAAACYASHASVGPEISRHELPRDWPWAPKWWKPGDQRRMLVKAGALILAEIERLDRTNGDTQ